jgi:hypothetical protein
MLKKIVNGVEVECSAEEEAQIKADWEAKAVDPATLEGTPSLEDIIANKVQELNGVTE